MSFRRDEKGFIFSLDAALAMLVILIMMAGVARIAGPELTYGQHGYLRLERYANDTLEVMQLVGTMDNIVNLVKNGENNSAENLARAELREILPEEVQFKFVVGNRLTVYPSDATNWGTAFSNAEEIAVATRMSTIPENHKILAWLDDEVDEDLMRELINYTGWENKSTSNKTEFWNEVSPGWGQKDYDVIFIPDADTDLDSNNPGEIWDLILWAWYGSRLTGGRIVVGGDTFYNNWGQNSAHYFDTYFWELLGVVFTWTGSSGVRPTSISGNPLDNMHIIDGNNFVTAPYEYCDNIEYNEDYTQYIYTPINNQWVVAQWEDVPGGVTPPVPGIIVRPAGTTVAGSYEILDPGVLFNMNFAESAMDPDNPIGTEDWINLARRAIGYDQLFERITLYVWRGPTLGEY